MIQNPHSPQFTSKVQFEVIKVHLQFLTQYYSISENKLKIIDPFVKLLLGVVIGIQQSELKTNADAIEMINQVAETLHSIILGGDPHLAKNFIASLQDNEKMILQKLVQVIQQKKVSEGANASKDEKKNSMGANQFARKDPVE